MTSLITGKFGSKIAKQWFGADALDALDAARRKVSASSSAAPAAPAPATNASPAAVQKRRTKRRSTGLLSKKVNTDKRQLLG